MSVGQKFTGLWSWRRGIYDLGRYLDLMAEWGFDTLFLWHDVVPASAPTIQAGAHRRGVDIVWGFSWGWDYAGAAGDEMRNLRRLLKRQGKKEDELLCPSEKDSRKWAREFVLGKFDREYAPLEPEGIYFQAFTEVDKCPCEKCQSRTMGELMLEWVEPIAEDLLKQYPGLWISCGIHNSDESFSAMRALDPRVNILWERERPPNKAYPAKDLDELRELVSLRGEDEDVGLLFRLYGSFGLTTEQVQDRELHERIARNWDAIETGKGRIEQAQVYNLGWNRSQDGWLGNPNVSKLLEWMRVPAESPAKRKGLVGLLEGSDWSLRPRFLPVIFGELAKDPLRPDGEIETALEEAWGAFSERYGAR
jgi:hypothetical protein